MDELCWGAAWLAKATGDSSYLSKAEGFYDDLGLTETPSEFSWDNKVIGATVLLYELTGSSKYEQALDDIIDYIMNGASYTPQGLIFIDVWGSLRHAGNLAHLCLQVIFVFICI